MIMLKRVPVAIAIVALAGGAIASTSYAATAQETAPAGPAGHDHMVSAEDQAAFLDARIAALHAGLELTPEQEKLWAPVDQALHDFGKLMASQWQSFREEKNPVAKLQTRADNLIARGEALKKVADAARPLYAQLTEPQKHRLPILLHAIRHPMMMGRFAMEGGWRHAMGRPMMGDHMMGDHMMGDHMMHEDDQDAPPSGPEKD
jgi:zinc resistance-associated protein